MGKTDRAIQGGLSPLRWVLPIALSAAVALWAPQSPRAGEVDADDSAEIDPVALAAVLIQDKHFERARKVLEEVDLNAQRPAVDRARYHLLFGLALLELGDHRGAETQFERSVKAGQKDPVAQVFLAQARFQHQDYRGALEALEKAGAAARALPGVFLIRTQSHWRSGDKAAAFHAVTQGIENFPDDDALRKNRVFLLVDMGLYQQAVDEGTVYLSSKAARSDEYAAFSEALIKAKRYDDAVILLENARLRTPGDKNVIIQLARAYMEGGHLFVAARLFEHASRTAPELTLDAAELYRLAGRLPPAVRLNERVLDQKAKIRQRLGLLIELERFEEAAALSPRLTRLGLLAEDDVVYGLAYSYFMTGRFKEAEAELKKISDPELFEKAIQLRRIMGSCSASGWQCP